MKVETPADRNWGAALLVGQRLNGGAPQVIGSLVVKAAFHLDPTPAGAETHALRAAMDPAAAELRFADEGDPAAPPVAGAAGPRETDAAPYKPAADVVVERFLPGNAPAAAQVRVDGAVWLDRAAAAPHEGDARWHLFGYEPRTPAEDRQRPRAGQAGNPLAGPVPDPLPPLPDPIPANFQRLPLRPGGEAGTATLGNTLGYQNGFLNFHRRGDGFAASVGAALAPGRRVAVLRGGAEALSVRLTAPQPMALYRIWCGSGPDKPPYWRRVRLGAMRLDTLILRPDVGLAELIWRSVWPWADQNPADYRGFRIQEGGV